MKIALGTVQFGLGYGAFNDKGQVAEDQVARILDRAQGAKIDTLDTARAYGNSEEVLGRLGAAQKFRIVTKSPPLGETAQAADALKRAADQSCKALNTGRLDGYILHRAEDLIGPQGDEIWQALEALKSQGRARQIGVSGYDRSVVEKLADRYPIDLVQLPANVLDPWFEEEASNQRFELHVRSAFLQGFLLSDPSRLSPFHQKWRGVLEEFRERAKVLGLSPMQAALGPLIASPRISRVVVGVDALAQFEEILGAMECSGTKSLGAFEIGDRNLLDPRTWPARGEGETS